MTRPRWVLSPILAFLRVEASAGIVLIGAAVVAVVWANSPAGDGYDELWQHELTIGQGSWAVREPLVNWVNEGLMTIFFFVIGLEIKRELVTGELHRPRAAALPAIAAIGGVVLPAAIYLAIAPGGEAANGWGVPMATDIVFAVGVLTLLGRGVASGTKLFLLSLALVDDVVAVLIIAITYSENIQFGWLGVAGVVLAIMWAMRGFVTSPWFYLVPAFIVWFCFLESGVHATLAGVALGLLTPARPVRGRPVLEDLESKLHPVSVYFVVPVFALANAGVDLGAGFMSAITAPLMWAVALGLLIGKTLGISAATFAALKLRLGTLPAGMTPRLIWPIAALGGIGFTVALFIADLAFDDPELINDAKVGIFVGSIAAGLLGAFLLKVFSARRTAAK